jgi:iron complex outermembrane recepter protein
MHMRRSHKVALILTLLAPSLGAQEGGDSAKKIKSVSSIATRVPVPVLSAPFALTVISADQFRLRRGFSLDEALVGVPGVLAQSRSGGTDIRLTIRGFGARGAGDRSNAGTARGVRVMIDGIPETEPDGRTAFDQLDLAAAWRIDVIRSNASSTWGNAAGGVVNVSTAAFDVAPFERVEQQMGSYGLNRSIVQFVEPIGTGNVAVTYTNTSGEGWRQGSDFRRAYLNIALQSPIGEKTDLGVFVRAANDLFHIPGPLTMAQYEADPEQANATYFSRQERRHNRLGTFGATLDRRLDESNAINASVYVNPKYLQRSERGTFRDFTRYHTGGSASYRNVATLSGMRVTSLIGSDLAYQDGAILFYNLTPSGERGTDLDDNKGEGAANVGAFLQEAIGIGDRTDLLVGARYDVIRYDYRSFIAPETNVAKKFERVTPKLGINFRVTPTFALYANMGGGIEAPAGNETNPASTFGEDTLYAINPLLDAIRSTTYEVGMKHLWARDAGMVRTVSYDVALYDIEVEDEPIPYRGGRFFFTAGKVRRQGLEIGGNVGLPAGFSFVGSGTFSRNKYVEYVVDSVHYGVEGAFADYSDNEIAGTPNTYYSAQINFEPMQWPMLRFEIGAQGVGKFFADDANAVEVPAYSVFNAGVGLRDPVRVGNVGVRGFLSVTNLSDKRYVGSAFTNPDYVGGFPVAFEPGMPRQLVVSLSVARLR